MRTIKHDDSRVSSCPDAGSVIAALPGWFAHDNSFTRTGLSAIVHPASSSRPDKPRKLCLLFKGQQQDPDDGANAGVTYAGHGMSLQAL